MAECGKNLKILKEKVEKYKAYDLAESLLEKDFEEKMKELFESTKVLWTHETLPQELKDIKMKMLERKRYKELVAVEIANLMVNLEEEGCEMKKVK